MLKLDVLSHFDEIKICTGYRLDGEVLPTFPARIDVLERVEPVWETHPGWREDISGARRWSDLPQAARSYLERIQELLEVPIAIVSVGPRREETLWLQTLLS